MLPLGREALFSYLSPDPVPSGSLVEIPFGKRKVQGIVYACRKLSGKASGGKWKPIEAVLEPALLTKDQLELARFVSQEYVTPLGRTLRHFAPPRAKARKKASSDETLAPSPSSPSAEIEKLAVQALTSRKKHPEFFLDTRTVSAPSFCAALAGRLASKQKQLLILVPETPLLDRYADELGRLTGREAMAVIESKLAPGAYWREWERIRKGEASIIIGTRHALFAPFRSLGAVAVAYEGDMSYKQWDMTPRYHAKAVARKLAALHGAALIWSTPAPSLETLAGVDTKSIRELGTGKKEPLPNLTLVNMREERYKKNFTPLSASAREQLKEALASGRQVLVYVHQSGTSSLSVCTECRSVLRCPECSAPLSETRDQGYFCRRCGHRAGSFPNCASCKNIGFRPLVYGTERIESFLRREFPAARVVRADGRSLQTRSWRQKVFVEGSAEKIDILLGTQVIAKDPPLPRLGAVVIIDADSLLTGTDFQNDERVLSFLGSLPLLYSALDHASVLIQTFQPEHPLFSTLSASGYRAAAEILLAERRALRYPPYSRLVTIEPLRVESQELEGRLQEFVQKERGARLVSVPQTPGRPASRFALHLNPGPLSASAQAFFHALGPVARIDPDPIRST